MASSVFYYRALHRYLRRDPSVAVLHAHFGFPDAILVYLATRRSKRPFVVTLHGDDVYRVLARRDPFGWLTRKAVSHARAVICVSEALADAVRSISTGVDPVVVANGYDDGLFRIRDIPRDLGLLFVGTLVPVKNLPVLLRAYASISSRLTADLTIAGEGNQRSELASLVDELGLGDRVHFVGALERQHVAVMMQRASALLLPSQSEGWPLVVGEALACGTPVVASRVGGIPEIVASEDGGILVEPGDEHGLAEALIAILERPNDPRRVAAASRAQPWSVQAERIAAIYREALDGRIAAAPPRVAS